MRFMLALTAHFSNISILWPLPKIFFSNFEKSWPEPIGPVVVAAAVAFLALAPTPAWHLILGIRSSALSIFVIVMAAVVVAPPTVHLVTAVAIAIAATAATPYATWMHSNRCNREDRIFTRAAGK